MKKLLLSLGTIAAIVAPIATVVSCGQKSGQKVEKEVDLAKEARVLENIVRLGVNDFTYNSDIVIPDAMDVDEYGWIALDGRLSIDFVATKAGSINGKRISAGSQVKIEYDPTINPTIFIDGLPYEASLDSGEVLHKFIINFIYDSTELTQENKADFIVALENFAEANGIGSGTSGTSETSRFTGSSTLFGVDSSSRYGGTSKYGDYLNYGVSSRYGIPTGYGDTAKYGASTGYGDTAKYGTIGYGATAGYGDSSKYGFAGYGDTSRYEDSPESSDSPEYWDGSSESSDSPEYGISSDHRVPSRYGDSSDHETSTGYGGDSSEYGTSPRYGDSSEYGTSPRYGDSSEYGTSAGYGTSTGTGDYTGYGASSRFGDTSGYGTSTGTGIVKNPTIGDSSRFGDTSRFGTSPGFKNGTLTTLQKRKIEKAVENAKFFSEIIAMDSRSGLMKILDKTSLDY